MAKYLLTKVLWGLGIAAMIVFGLLALVDFVEATRNVDVDEQLSNLDLLGLTLLKVPSLLEQTLPFIVLFAAIGTLNGLNRRSELIATRAAGVSAWRYLRPALIVAGMVGLIWVSIGNPGASHALRLHDEIRDNSRTGANATDNGSVIWLRDANETTRTVLKGESFDRTTRTLSGVSWYQFDRQDEGDIMRRRIEAESATFLATGYWQLSDVQEWKDGIFQTPMDSLSLPTQLTERDIYRGADRANSRQIELPPVWELPGLIRTQAQAGFSTLLPRMKLWKLTALPILLVAMTLIGACVSMRLSREGGTWRLLMAGGIIGFGVFFSSVFVEAFGEVGTLPPLIAAWTVPILALLIGLAYLAKLEDG